MEFRDLIFWKEISYIFVYCPFGERVFMYMYIFAQNLTLPAVFASHPISAS